MRLWAKCIADNRITHDVVREFAPARPSDITGWNEVLDDICHELDLSRPVMLSKHLKELRNFSRTSFRPDDFMEPIDFDRLDIEIFPEKKKR